ncbi:MAG: hypothetical protein ACRD0V_16195 [Acidimicrobiales bacterium]
MSPYHSINLDPEIHHVVSDCPSCHIPPKDKREGTNGWALCGTCRIMGA